MSDESWFNIDITPDFMRVETFGQRSGEASEELWRAVSKASVESGSKKVLVVSYRDGTLPINSMETIAKDYHELVTGEHKFALVLTGTDFERESVGETVSQSAGINLRAFRDTDTALRWLQSDE